MAQIDAKWIQFDDEKLSIVVKEIDGKDTNFLSIRDDIVLAGVGCEYINLSKFELRFLSEGVPVEEVDRDMSRDFWIQTPDQV